MYNNPQLFKANMIMQKINKRMKKQAGDETYVASEFNLRRASRDDLNNCQMAKQVGISHKVHHQSYRLAPRRDEGKVKPVELGKQERTAFYFQMQRISRRINQRHVPE